MSKERAEEVVHLGHLTQELLFPDDSYKFYHIDNKKVSLLFMQWMKQAEEKNYLGNYFSETLDELLDYIRETAGLMDNLCLAIAKKEQITQADLKRLEGIAELKKVAHFFQDNFDFEIPWEVVRGVAGEELNQKSKKKLEQTSHFFDMLTKFKVELSKVGVDQKGYVDIMEKLALETQDTACNFKLSMEELLPKYIGKGSFKNINNLIVFLELSFYFSQIFSSLCKDDGPLISAKFSCFIREMDWEKELDLGNIPCYVEEHIDLTGPDYYNL